jgi:hypothetical protein
MTRNTIIALAVSVALLGTAIESRADDHYVRGGVTESRAPSLAGVDAQPQRPVRMRFPGTN